MATSLKRRSSAKISHAKTKAVELSLTSKKNAIAKGKTSVTPDSYGFSHIAKVLINGTRDQMLGVMDRLKGKARILYEIASYSKHPFLRLSAITSMSHDHEAFVDIAKYCEFADTRAAALDELATDSDALVEVASSSNYKDSRLDAVLLLANNKGLVAVASKSPNQDSRTAALEKLAFDQGSIERVIEETPYKKTREEALAKLNTNLHALSSIMAKSKNPEVKRLVAKAASASVEQIEDLEALVEIAKHSPNQDARYLAVGKMWKNPQALKKIVNEAEYKDSKATAMMLLSDIVETISDSEALVEVATNSPYEDCRTNAIEKLAGISSALLEVASKSKYKNSRSQAIEYLKKDGDTLKNVIKRTKYKDTRAQAFKIVSEPKFFESELGRILG